jgi:tetratricopeptide (TPR) repeat protein
MARKFFENEEFVKGMKTLESLVDQPIHGEIHKEARRLYHRCAEKEMARMYNEGEKEGLVLFYETNREALRGNIDPEIILLVGLSLYELEQYQDALSILENIRPFDLSRASNGKRALALVKTLLALGKKEKALRVLEDEGLRSRLTAADTQRLLVVLAGLYKDMRRLDRAMRLYEDLTKGQALLSEKEMAEVHLEMGRIAGKKGEVDQARASLNRCIELASRSADNVGILSKAYAELGNSYFQEARYAKALEAYEKALNEGYSREDKGYWDMLFRMAQSYLETGDYDAAEPLLVQVTEEADPLLQQRGLIRLGTIELERQLKRLPIKRAEP